MAEVNRCPNCNSIINPTSECDYCGFEFTLVKKGSSVDYSDAVSDYRKSEQFKTTDYFKSLISRGCACCGGKIPVESFPKCPACCFENGYFANATDDYSVRIEKYRASSAFKNSPYYKRKEKEEAEIKFAKQREAEEQVRKEEEARKKRETEKDIQKEDILQQIIAQDKRSKIVDSVSNIRVIIHEYGWSPSASQFELRKTNSNVIAASGRDCDNKICWSKLKIGQYIPDGQSTLTLTVSFDVALHHFEERCDVKPVDSSDFWRIGTKLTEDNKLVFCLGADRGDVWNESTPIDLNPYLRMLL